MHGGSDRSETRGAVRDRPVVATIPGQELSGLVWPQLCTWLRHHREPFRVTAGRGAYVTGS
jgi:hypothetical protein